MIEIKWRLREHFEAVDEALLPVAHDQLVTAIQRANKTHDHIPIIGYMRAQIEVCKKLIMVNPAADESKLQDGVKALIKSIYNTCPGAVVAVKKDGSLDADYLPA